MTRVWSSVWPRARRWGYRAALTAGCVGGGYAMADLTTDRSFTRSLRALRAFFTVCYMYKFTVPETPEQYHAMHRRAAEVILDVCLRNEGLYIKLGQGMNAMNHILPPEYTETLKVLLDNAPPVPFKEIVRIIKKETGCDMDDLFNEFEEEPIASASIAQIHRAKLKARDGETTQQVVAVKVQKPSVSRQAKWDIYTYEIMNYVVENVFDLPISWSRQTIVDGLRREMDFTIEAENAEHFRRTLAHHPHIYVPRVHGSYTTKRLLVLEWIEATKLLDTEAIRRQFDEKAVLKTVFDAFGDMVFKDGFVHCDPHAANILVRPRSQPGDDEGHASQRRSSSFEVVLLDFGLCVAETERFRLLYALFFKSLFAQDMSTVQRVVHDWGIRDADMFASLQIQKPLTSLQSGCYGEVTQEEVLNMQRASYARVRNLLSDAQKIPRELPMVGRGMDILRGVNRLYGSPINRVNMFVKSAVECLGPWRDYDSIQRYLAKVKQLTDEEVSEPTVFNSAYDESAKRYREAQEAAIREVKADEESSMTHLAVVRLQSLYSLCSFHLALFRLAVIHTLIGWYNSLVTLIAPPTVVRSFQIDTIEDRIDKFENSLILN